ncbi:MULTISPECIES: type II secretion system F family protein [Arthrobacter]|uniref:Type II secretion system protein F n=1 Tax=Arthrobacter oryzae TaxID=409290 RepID=A0A3N0C3B2_9MICC|nr:MULTISPECIES: type II secretion system F family protein [Arthrobacter]QYF89721.1 type II secretion system F family protein [Arthrobacter sp. PAMC25284]RNL57111.1 type II secretion system protein F [Arthrobacter oryzae]
MTGLMASATVCGVLLGAGLWLLLVRLPFMRPVSFVERIGPQLKAQNLESRLLRTAPGNNALFGPLESILRPVIRDAVASLGRINPGSAALARRLARAGSVQTTADFRAEQILWAAGGFILSLLVVVLGGVVGRFSPVMALAAVLGSAAGGYLLRDYVLGARIKKRETRMMAEFPSIAELMALAVSAGQSATGALDRVCCSAHGELPAEFSRVLTETRSGKPLIEALQEFSARTDLGPLVRFVDGLIVAVERGTPLADVLRAQAQDVRDTAKRDLMEAAGRKEIGMMVPLVFGVLPLTVVFAVFPGLAAISFGL